MDSFRPIDGSGSNHLEHADPAEPTWNRTRRAAGRPARSLIVNADDFGRSPGINRGVVEAHQRGIVTSASLMVRWPAAQAAAHYARHRHDFSLGLHVDLGEWRLGADGVPGSRVPVYEVVPLDDPAAILAEVERQVTAFLDLVDGAPTHLDSHQHVHRVEPVRSILAELADALDIPLRQQSPRVRYAGGFYGLSRTGEPRPAAIGVDALIQIVEQLPPGVTELSCHPGRSVELDTPYRQEREREVETLSDPRVRAAIDRAGIRLRSFYDLGTPGFVAEAG